MIAIILTMILVVNTIGIVLVLKKLSSAIRSVESMHESLSDFKNLGFFAPSFTKEEKKMLVQEIDESVQKYVEDKKKEWEEIKKSSDKEELE